MFGIQIQTASVTKKKYKEKHLYASANIEWLLTEKPNTIHNYLLKNRLFKNDSSEVILAFLTKK